MAITFKRDFIISQLKLAINAGENTAVLDEQVQHEIERQIQYRDRVIATRDVLIKTLSEVDYKKGKPADVRRAVGAALGQYSGGPRSLTEELPSDETIRNNAINAYSKPRQGTGKLRYKQALDVLSASNTENVSYTDLKQLGILGIESYGAKAIEAADGITEHTEE